MGYCLIGLLLCEKRHPGSPLHVFTQPYEKFLLPFLLSRGRSKVPGQEKRVPKFPHFSFPHLLFSAFSLLG